VTVDDGEQFIVHRVVYRYKLFKGRYRQSDTRYGPGLWSWLLLTTNVGSRVSHIRALYLSLIWISCVARVHASYIACVDVSSQLDVTSTSRYFTNAYLSNLLRGEME